MFSLSVVKNQFFLSKICNKSKKVKDIYILSPQFQVTYFILNIFFIQTALHSWTEDFMSKLGIKPPIHLLERSIFSLNHVIVRPIKIMNRADKTF